jgi:TPP-dependent pyruvate/acetoin dehydrogenase alpha subunit
LSWLYHIEKVSKEVAVKMYSDMVTLQMMDTIFYEAQRQGRISFYLTTLGEEAINIASAAALSADDLVLPQVNLLYHITYVHLYIKITVLGQDDMYNRHMKAA